MTLEPFVHRLRVRYNECDMQGIVFNSHYYTWMDIAHQELIREVLGPLDVLHSLGADVVVAESSARYFASARFDDEIDIGVTLDSLTTSSMTTVHTFRRGENGAGRRTSAPRRRGPQGPHEDPVARGSSHRLHAPPTRLEPARQQ